MLAKDYFLYAITKELLYTLEWFYCVMTLPNIKDSNNKYRVVKNNAYYVIIEGEEIKIDDVDIKRPLLNLTDKIDIPANFLPNNDKELQTTVGRVIMNKLLLTDNFGNKIQFINERFNIDKIEATVAKLLLNDIVTVKSYINFVDVCSFLHGLSRITTVAATPKGMLPPPGIDKFKTKVKKELEEKYGPNWTSNRSNVAEYENRLREFDSEWLADDPANGKVLSGKVKNEARSKMHLVFGAEAGFDKKGDNVSLVDNSLMDGYPLNPELLTTMFNTSRSGSFDRGNETQKGGSTAKDILRATSAIRIVDKDCGSKLGKSILVTKDNKESLIGRYQIINGKTVLIEDIEPYMDKVIVVRSPLRCKTEGNNLCSICVGSILANYPTGINLVVLDISNSILTASLKSMHKSSLSSIVFDIRKVLF